MKKKILSLVMSFCLCICSLFSLAGCSVVSEDKTITNKKEIMKVGDLTLTKADVINSFYTYYQNNNSYFSYYDEETIVESFYSWSVIKEIVNEKSEKALYNPETNPTGFIVYDADDAKEVREALFEYVYSQINSYEKAIYALNGVEEEDYPVWLRSEEEEDETTSGFKAYESVKMDIDDIQVHDKASHVEKLTEEQVKAFESEIKTYLFEYVTKKAENDDEEDVRANMNTEQSVIRNQAYAKYIEGLVSNAKANGTSTDETVVFLNEIVRVYNAYYDSKVSSLFKSYWTQNYLLNHNAVDIDGDGVIDCEKDSLSDKEVVTAYLEKYFTNMQLYQVEDSYITALTGEDGPSLILYNYNGRNYFFTVQHILVKYDDYIDEKVSDLPGHGASGSDYDSMIHENYLKERDDLTNSYSMYTTINKSNIERFTTNNEIEIVGNYYFYDEEYQGDSSKNYGYILLTVSEEGDETVYRRSDNSEIVDEADVKYLASEDDVLDAYNTNLTRWVDLVNQYVSANETDRETILEDNSEIDYVLNTALDMSNNGCSSVEIKNKLASFLFVELQWIYSTDTLGNEYTNKLGYVMSNYEDENGNWVVDFAVGAREILANLQNGDTSAITTDNFIISDYGYHIIKIDNIFESGKSLVDMSLLTKEIDIDNAEFVEEMTHLLKKTYICSASNQSLYDYFYDEIYTGLVGSSESAGTYFTALQYEWLAEYYNAEKIEYFTKLTYDELMDSIA